MRIKLANLYLQIAEWGKTRSSSFANRMRRKADQLAANENGKMVVILSEKDFNYFYVDANNTDNVPWDDLYHSGGIFINGYANPVKLDYEETKGKVKQGDLDLITSSRYRDYMKQHALRDSFTYNTSDGLSIEQWQMITVAAIVFLALVVAGVAL